MDQKLLLHVWEGRTSINTNYSLMFDKIPGFFSMVFTLKGHLSNRLGSHIPWNRSDGWRNEVTVPSASTRVTPAFAALSSPRSRGIGESWVWAIASCGKFHGNFMGWWSKHQPTAIKYSQEIWLDIITGCNFTGWWLVNSCGKPWWFVQTVTQKAADDPFGETSPALFQSFNDQWGYIYT